MNYQEILKTKLQKGNPKGLNEKRIKRIEEAFNWKTGLSLEKPQKHVIAELPNEMVVYFLKPGKEVFRDKKPNPNDMKPCVGYGEKSYGFNDMWKQLSKISVYNFEIFRAVLTLIYRNAFMLDHVEHKGNIRYKPSKEISECIKRMGQSIDYLLDYGLFGLLHFMDILAWNEDVKYHVEDGKPTFKGKYTWRTGRLNTLLTCITIPYNTCLFVKDILEHSSERMDINWSLVYDTMQLLLWARGVCPPKPAELIKWLFPYIIEDASQTKFF